jgi:predicted DsbA family dithiol-disulfide isomerase
MIEVYADIWCPFTHVGLRRLVERRDETGAAFDLRVRSWPLELVNGAPMDPAFIAEEVEDLRAQVAPDLFVGFRPDRFPTSTLAALALAESAYDVDAACGERISLALRDALFEQGRDIGLTGVLAEIAQVEGLELVEGDEQVRASWEGGRARGVVGSPHFFTSSGGFFCPGLHIERIDGHLRIAPDHDAFEAFVASAVGTTSPHG